MGRYSGRFNRLFGKAEKGFATALLDAGQTTTKKGFELIDAAALEAIRSIDWEWPRGKDNGSYASGYLGGDAEHPWYSGTLHDSVAVGVAEGSVLRSMRFMTPGATFDQEYNGQKIDGAEYGVNALMDAVKFGSGARGGRVGSLMAVLVVGVPYADYINESPLIGWQNTTPNTHRGFIKELGEYFAGEVIGAANALSKLQIKTK